MRSARSRLASLSLILRCQTELAVNTNTNVADIRQDVLKIHEDVSKIREDSGSQNRVVCGMRTQYHFSIHANRCLG